MIHIKNLRCRITLKAEYSRDILGKSAHAQTPALHFLQAPIDPVAESEPVPAETATQEKGDVSQEKTISPRKADPAKVAARVYDLMKEEVHTARLRRGLW